MKTTLAMMALGASQILYNMVPENGQTRIHEKRLRKYLNYVKEHSPYYARQWQDIDVETCNLLDIPPIGKPQVMNHYDELVTDSDVSLADIQSFIDNPENKKKKYLGRYKIARTSGSTYIPIVIPYNDWMRANYAVCGMTHLRISQMPHAAVLADPGYTLGSLLSQMGDNSRNFAMVDAVQPVEQLVKRLNDIQPKHIQGFTGTLVMLAHEAQEGRLRIHPKVIDATGEDITPAQREYLQDVFGCRVCSVYNASEMGLVARDCSHGHMHYCGNHLIIEPVDEHNNPVPDGVESDHILVTNMLAKPLPIVRYELGDRIIVHREGCACGSKRPWIELCGRTGLRGVEFHRNGTSHFIPMLSLEENCFDDLKTLSVQLIVHDEHHFEARLRCYYEGSWDEFSLETEGKFRALFHEYGIDDVSIEVNDSLPIPDPVTGKVKTILSLIDD